MTVVSPRSTMISCRRTIRRESARSLLPSRNLMHSCRTERWKSGKGVSSMGRSEEQTDTIINAQWEQYERDGYLKLGKILSDDALLALQQRIDEIMLGKAALDYNRLMMQLDSPDGQYQNAGPQSRGWKGA